MESKERAGFTFYRSFRDSLSVLDEAAQLTMYRAICDFALDGKEPKLKDFSAAMFNLIRPYLYKDRKQWANGIRGAAPIGNKNAKKQPKNNPKTTQPHY